MHPFPASIGNGAVLASTLVAAAVGSVVVFLVALKAFERRRTLSYLLVALAIGTLVVRTLIGGLTTGGVLPPATHHVAEHGLDVLLVGFLIAAVYASRTSRQSRRGDGS